MFALVLKHPEGVTPAAVDKALDMTDAKGLSRPPREDGPDPDRASRGVYIPIGGDE